jgi:hypothetical protein
VVPEHMVITINPTWLPAPHNLDCTASQYSSQLK